MTVLQVATLFEAARQVNFFVRRSGRSGVEAITGALVYAVVYLNRRLEDGDETYLDADTKAIESIAGFLRHATWEEQDELAAAAEREFAKERAMPRPRPEFLHDYAHWMEEMFGEGWRGNRRVVEE